VLARIIALLLVAGCANEVANAVVWSAVAVTASAVNRATGGCYASCGHGTVCNPISGLCEALPCRGECTEDERCDTSGLAEKCVSKRGDDIVISNEGGSKPEEESQEKE
jgi:hypothetical protein